MNTIILFWNPGISSYTIKRLREDLTHYAHVGNWSVWEHDKAHKGDRFFMVRCGEGKTGICMSGRFRSEPYKGEDWTGKGREVYYMDLMADVVIDPDVCPILSTVELQSLIPDFKWDGGHSGRLLPAEEAEKPEDKWEEFLAEHEEIFIHHTLKKDDIDGYFGEEEDKEEKDAIREEPATITLDPESTYIITDDSEEVEVAGDDLGKLKKELEKKLQAIGREKPTSYLFADIDEEDQWLFAKIVLLAREAYKDMPNRNGESYWAHLVERMEEYNRGSMKMVVLLSGILKHPDYTPKRLIQSGVPKMIVDAVDAMTQREGENLDSYIARVLDAPMIWNILDNELYDELTSICDLPVLTDKDTARINQQLKIRQSIKKAKNESSISVFRGKPKNFKRWMELNHTENIAIEGQYKMKEFSAFAKVLEELRYYRIDISGLNIVDGGMETMREIILDRLSEDEEDCYALDKMILNRKYSTVFVKKWAQVVTDDGKVLVHVPTDYAPQFEPGIEIIGTAAVANNKSIRELIYPNGITTIDDYAFANCPHLVSVRLPDTVTQIGKRCFYSCCIDDLVLSQSLAKIPNGTFAYNCIEHVDIPPSVRRIGAEAFFCNCLTGDIIVPEGVETIEFSALHGRFDHVSLPSTLKEIAYDFYYEEMVDDPEEMKPYVEVHPDNPVYYSQGGILYSRATGKEVLGRAGREHSEQN